MEPRPRKIQRYTTVEGKVPFYDWLKSLREVKLQTIINKRLDRLSLGNFGNYKSVGAGVYELRINYGAGYRIYFGLAGAIVVILLCGGDKHTQERDIRKAKEYWNDYKKRTSPGK